jgi:uncharacterized protein YlbG (UPF0298 family)
MNLWGELVECYHGVNGYGGITAEIYSYRFSRYDPYIHQGIDIFKDKQPSEMYIQRTGEQHIHAANALVELVQLFCDAHDVEAMIDNMTPKKWLKEVGEGFSHRAHVRITHK